MSNRLTIAASLALPLLAGLVLSWAAGLAVTAVVSQFALKAQNGFRSRRAS